MTKKEIIANIEKLAIKEFKKEKQEMKNLNRLRLDLLRDKKQNDYWIYIVKNKVEFWRNLYSTRYTYYEADKKINPLLLEKQLLISLLEKF